MYASPCLPIRLSGSLSTIFASNQIRPVRAVALRLQQILRYVLHSVANFSQSYNYFVYNLEDGYDYIKVVARYVTTPLYVDTKYHKLAMRTSC